MKKTDLEKLKAMKIVGRLAQSGTPPRFGSAATAPALDRRAQRKRDQEAGLVPFAAKLPAALVAALHAAAAAEQRTPGALLADLLTAGLAARPAAGPGGYHGSIDIQEG